MMLAAEAAEVLVCPEWAPALQCHLDGRLPTLDGCTSECASANAGVPSCGSVKGAVVQIQVASSEGSLFTTQRGSVPVTCRKRGYR